MSHNVYFISVIFFCISEPNSIPEFLLIMVGMVVVVTLVIVLFSEGADKSKEVAEKIRVKIEQKRKEKELDYKIKSDIQYYKESKNSFQYFSDDNLLSIYEEFKSGTKDSNMEQLALEEELVKRKLIDHSPMHEKLYWIKKHL